MIHLLLGIRNISHQKSTKGGTLLYINKNIESKERTDLEKNLYIPKKLESIFIELIIKGKTKHYRLHLQTSEVGYQ